MLRFNPVSVEKNNDNALGLQVYRLATALHHATFEIGSKANYEEV